MNASASPSTRTSPASAIWLRASPPNAGTNSPSIRLWVAFPPAPWAIVICGVAELGAPAADVLDEPEDVLLPVGDRRPVVHHTTSRSRAKRPKL